MVDFRRRRHYIRSKTHKQNRRHRLQCYSSILRWNGRGSYMIGSGQPRRCAGTSLAETPLRPASLKAAGEPKGESNLQKQGKATYTGRPGSGRWAGCID